MNFSGTFHLPEDATRLPADIEVADGRVMIHSDGHLIGDWRAAKLELTHQPNGILLRSNGEELVVSPIDRYGFSDAVAAERERRATRRRRRWRRKQRPPAAPGNAEPEPVETAPDPDRRADEPEPPAAALPEVPAPTRSPDTPSGHTASAATTPPPTAADLRMTLSELARDPFAPELGGVASDTPTAAAGPAPAAPATTAWSSLSSPVAVHSDPPTSPHPMRRSHLPPVEPPSPRTWPFDDHAPEPPAGRDLVPPVDAGPVPPVALSTGVAAPDRAPTQDAAPPLSERIREARSDPIAAPPPAEEPPPATQLSVATEPASAAPPAAMPAPPEAEPPPAEEPPDPAPAAPDQPSGASPMATRTELDESEDSTTTPATPAGTPPPVAEPAALRDATPDPAARPRRGLQRHWRAMPVSFRVIGLAILTLAITFVWFPQLTATALVVIGLAACLVGGAGMADPIYTRRLPAGLTEARLLVGGGLALVIGFGIGFTSF